MAGVSSRVSRMVRPGCAGKAVTPRRLGVIPRMIPDVPQAVQHIIHIAVQGFVATSRLRAMRNPSASERDATLSNSVYDLPVGVAYRTSWGSVP